MMRKRLFSCFLAVCPLVALVRAAPADVRAAAGDEVREALTILSASTSAKALPGSARVGLGVYERTGPCTEAMAAYRAPGAPVPARAEITEHGIGVLSVSLPFARSAIFFADHRRGCRYRVVDAPTLEISGPKPVPAGVYFSRIACEGADAISSGAIAGEFETATGTHAIFSRWFEVEEVIDGGPVVSRVLRGIILPGKLTDIRGQIPEGVGWGGDMKLDVSRDWQQATATIASPLGEIKIAARCLETMAGLYQGRVMPPLAPGASSGEATPKTPNTGRNQQLDAHILRRGTVGVVRRPSP